MAGAGLAVGGDEDHVREVLGGRGLVAELCNFRVEIRADPRHLQLRHTGICAECFELVSTLRVYSLCIQVTITTANNAWSTRWCRSRSAGKNDPARTLGIF